MNTANDGAWLVSVVVPCRGHASELRRCLASIVLLQFTGTFEIIVVDAAADDRMSDEEQCAA